MLIPFGLPLSTTESMTIVAKPRTG